MRTHGKMSLGRRRFFRVLATGAAATAIPLAGEAVADTETSDEKRKARYKESDEVKTYYRVNRYPS
jgi:hypothetical protein